MRCIKETQGGFHVSGKNITKMVYKTLMLNNAQLILLSSSSQLLSSSLHLVYQLVPFSNKIFISFFPLGINNQKQIITISV